MVGSNGSGKTSMLNLICGSIPADAGKVILVNGTDITGQKEYMRDRRPSAGYSRTLLPEARVPNMTVLENMAVADHEGKRLWI